MAAARLRWASQKSWQHSIRAVGPDGIVAGAFALTIAACRGVISPRDPSGRRQMSDSSSSSQPDGAGPLTVSVVNEFPEDLYDAMRRFDVTTPERKQHFLAQVAPPTRLRYTIVESVGKRGRIERVGSYGDLERHHQSQVPLTVTWNKGSAQLSWKAPYLPSFPDPSLPGLKKKVSITKYTIEYSKAGKKETPLAAKPEETSKLITGLDEKKQSSYTFREIGRAHV